MWGISLKKTNSQFLRNHFVLTAVTAVVFSVIIFGIVNYATSNDHRLPKGPVMTFVKLIEKTKPENRKQLITDLKSAAEDLRDFKLGHFSSREEVLKVLKQKEMDQNRFDHDVRVFGRFRERGFEIIPFNGENGREYLALHFMMRRRIPPFILIPITILLVALFTAMVSTIFNYRSFGKFYDNARVVIDRIKCGDFNARFEISRLDEVGQSMIAFNEMAEEVEKYVNKIKSAESNRIRILQDLAHDLRTPIASLKNTMVTLRDKRERMDKKLQDEFFTLATDEINYFEKLVEDLLFLAKMSEPKYEVSQKEFLLDESLLFEIDRLQKIHTDKKVEIEGLPEGGLTVIGDEHHFKRMIRNALDNAISFAQEKVSVKVSLLEESFSISVIDDGPGFPLEVLQEFGKRKVSRYETRAHQGRVSVGLGSVIMKTITELHHGELFAENLEGNGKTSGAKVTLSFPRL